MLRKLPNWADAPATGYPGAIAPPSGKRSDGWANGEEPAAAHVNYVVQAVADLQNEVTRTIEGLGGTLSGTDLYQQLKVLTRSHTKLALSSFKLAEDVGTNVTLNALARASDITIAVGASASIQRLVLSSGAYQAGGFVAEAAALLYGGAFQDIAYGAGLFVIVGTLEEIQSSAGDGSWTRRRTGTKTLYAVTYGGGKFVAVGQDGRIVYSSDGITWTVATSAITNDFHSVVYVAGKFVAGTDTRALAYSADGITWSTVFNLAEASDASSMAVSASMGAFYAWAGHIYYSADGVTWTEVQTLSSGTAMRLFAGPYFWACVYREAAGSRIVAYDAVTVNAASAFTIEYALTCYLNRLYQLDGQYWALGGSSGSFDQIYIGGVA